ncbi:hypothetical protein F4780DRAFT_782682 [Xylariomycetidae sp. FL0641]|nr:hypothetical protein F4780DRAFT_782682 [Xylariomycetidae sp. FL0641]
MYASTGTILAAFTAVAVAVDISGAPPCAQKCLVDNQKVSHCDPNDMDLSCYCTDANYYAACMPCIAGGCSGPDMAMFLNWYAQECPPMLEQ